MTQEQQWLLNEKYAGIESSEFRADCQRLASGEPLAYVIGWIPFCKTKIFLDSHPLIPRAETEFWVTKAIEDIRSQGLERPRVLDLCAGSGCIGIATLKAIPGATCDLVEIDIHHHETIRKNLIENNISPERVQILGGSLFEQVSGNYDVILTNPPYIDPILSERIQKSVLAHEPDLALFGGVDGMDVVSEILKQTPSYLKSGGILYIEHEPEQEIAIQKHLPGIISHPDQYGLIRYSTYTKDE